ncbi:MAG TPA: hypothetical protein VIS48_14515 [Candidatus Kryptonia bacterium]
MKPNSDGKTLISEATQALGRKFEFGHWMELLQESSSRLGKSSIFEDLSFDAKGFQKVYRLVGSAGSNGVDKSRAADELKTLLDRISAKLEILVGGLPEDTRDEFRKEFLAPSGGSFENMRKLISDFGLMKEYFLIERDKANSK